LNAQRTMKNDQNYCHVKNRHCGRASELRDEISMAFSCGMALPKSGYNSAEFTGSRLIREAGGRSSSSSGKYRAASG
jgi:hypothetical protein